MSIELDYSLVKLKQEELLQEAAKQRFISETKKKTGDCLNIIEEAKAAYLFTTPLLFQGDPNCLSGKCLKGPAAVVGGGIVGGALTGLSSVLLLRHTRSEPSEEYLTQKEKEYVTMATLNGIAIGTLLALLSEIKSK
jgi:hypothetical protein